MKDLAGLHGCPGMVEFSQFDCAISMMYQNLTSSVTPSYSDGLSRTY